MIRIVMDGMCQGCNYADLELDYVDLSFCGQKEWYIQCNHRDACDHMETITIHKIKQGDTSACIS